MILGSLLPHEPFIWQEILIKIEDNSYEAWITDKRNYALHGEIVEFEGDHNKYHPMILYCDIQVEPKQQKCGYRNYYGIASLRSLSQ